MLAGPYSALLASLGFIRTRKAAATTSFISLQTALPSHSTTHAWWWPERPGSSAHSVDRHHLPRHPLASTFSLVLSPGRRRMVWGELPSCWLPPTTSSTGAPANSCRGPLSLCTRGCLQIKSPLLGRKEIRTCGTAQLEGLKGRLAEHSLKMRLRKARSQLEQAGIHRALAIYTSWGFGLLF